MDVIKTTRELGAALQKDERYLKYAAAQKAAEDDVAVKELYDKLTFTQMAYQQEMGNDEPNEEALSKMEADFQATYGELASNETMQKFDAARAELDELMNYIMQILTLCIQGEDPATCEPVPETHECGGSCSSCAGCP
jgi:cell fate (sporulation/competence/biofilm development) regulator YlbF (YheA/YmcA/DUF963 family)